MHARAFTCCMACACNLLNRSESKALRAIQTALEAPDPDKGRKRPFPENSGGHNRHFGDIAQPTVISRLN